MKYAEVKNDYLMEIEHIEKLTKTTCIKYKSNSNHYEKWLAADGHENADAEFAFSLQTLKKYQMSLSKRGQRPRSIRGKFNPLRGMVTYLIKNGYMEKNPFDLLKQPKKDAAIRLTMTKTEAEAIWEACERHPDPRQVAFWRALMAALLFTGARADEVTKIEANHINLEDEALLIASGKGQKSRCLSLTTETVVAYKAWIAERAKM